jgi:hypothetical protein
LSCPNEGNLPGLLQNTAHRLFLISRQFREWYDGKTLIFTCMTSFKKLSEPKIISSVIISLMSFTSGKNKYAIMIILPHLRGHSQGQ